MSTSDAALDWLISLSAVFTSSPIPASSSPDFTEWLHKSPRFDQSSPDSSQLCTTSPALQDVSFSSRVNMAQLEDLGLNYSYDISCQGVENDVASLIKSVAASSRGEGQRNSAPMPFSQHNRMVSLESTSATLVNTPSPHFLSPSGHIWRPDDHSRSPYPSSVFYSPATKFVQELQDVSFGTSFSGLASTSLQADTLMSDISPILRAEQAGMSSQSPNGLNKCLKTKKRRKGKKSTTLEAPQTFLEKLTSIPLPANPPNAAVPANLVPDPNICSQNALITAQPILLSPCKITAAPIQASSSDAHPSEPALTSALPAAFPDGLEETTEGLPITPLNRTSPPANALTPLTPLTPLLDSSPVSAPPLKITLRLKRPLMLLETPPRRSKRARRAVFTTPSPSPEAPNNESASPEPSVSNVAAPIFTNRTLPSTITINPTFSLFYRRFPASSYYQAPNTGQASKTSPCSLFGVAHPGGVYNTPRSALDLYTPRFVRGKGTEKVGLCSVCVEPPERGGESKKLWLAMKFSAFKCYHMQYAHGISASTGRPFSPPTAFRIVPRVNPGKKEKPKLMHGKCHKCAKWVPIEGIKDMESKVKELHWWKHAASCHQESSLSGEGDYYEDDNVYKTLLDSQQWA